MFRINIVESQQKWIRFVIDERNYIKQREEQSQSPVESRTLLCRICLGHVDEEPNQVDSVYVLPEKMKDLFLNIQEYQTHSNIPEKLCAKCTVDMQVSYQIMEACETMRVFAKSDKKCLICRKECKSKYHIGMKELSSLILILTDVPDQETVDAIRNGRYCDNCIASLQTAKKFRYKSYKSEEVLKLQFEQYLKFSRDIKCDPDHEEAMDVEYLDENDIKVEQNLVKLERNNPELDTKDAYYAPFTVDDSEEETDFFSIQLNTPPSQIMYKCPQCSATYGHEPDVIIHFDIMHNTKGTLCNECGLSCKTIASLRQHKIRIHYEVYDHICEICGRQFPGKAKYQAHYVTHFDARNVLCQMCSSAFKTKKALNLHMRCHTGEKPYACEVCHKRFSHHSDKKRHTYTHTDERPYNCEICQKGMFCHGFKRYLLLYYCIYFRICQKEFTQESFAITRKNVWQGKDHNSNYIKGLNLCFCILIKKIF